MFKLKFISIVLAVMMLFGVSCTSAPDPDQQKKENAQSAQKARDAANSAFLGETEEGIGDKDVPDSLPSKSIVPQDEPVLETIPESSITSFDEPDVMFAMVDQTSTEQPLWVKNSQKLFPPSQYLSAVGMGKNTVDAENSAIASIAKIIKQNVSSSVITTEKDSVSSSGSSATSSTLDEIIETYSVVDALVGVKIYEFWWSEDGDVYAVAYLNKEEAAQYYSTKISENENLIEENLIFAKNNKGSFNSYAALQRAVGAAEENNQYLDILNAVKPSAYGMTSLSYGSLSHIKEVAFALAQSINIDISVTGNDDGRVASAISLMLSKHGFKTKIVEDVFSASYLVEATVEFKDVPSERNKYVRYIFNSSLIEADTGKVLLPYSENQREGHTSVSEAQQKALRTLEKSIAENYAQAFIDYLKKGQ